MGTEKRQTFVVTKVKNTFKILKFRYTSTSSSSDKGRSGGIPLLAKSGATSTTSGDDRSIDHIGTQSLSCRLSGGDSSTSGQGSGTSGATTGSGNTSETGSISSSGHLLVQDENNNSKHAMD